MGYIKMCKKRELCIHQMMVAARTPQGTEERKRLKQLMTFTTKPQSIPSIDYSDSTSQRRAGAGEYRERGERTCRPSSKTDMRINSYFRSKSSTPKGVK